MATGGRPHLSAYGGQVVARRTRCQPVQLRWEWSTTHTGAVGFCDSQHVMQQSRADARTRRCVTRHAVA